MINFRTDMILLTGPETLAAEIHLGDVSRGRNDTILSSQLRIQLAGEKAHDLGIQYRDRIILIIRINVQHRPSDLLNIDTPIESHLHPRKPLALPANQHQHP